MVTDEAWVGNEVGWGLGGVGAGWGVRGEEERVEAAPAAAEMEELELELRQGLLVEGAWCLLEV